MYLYLRSREPDEDRDRVVTPDTRVYYAGVTKHDNVHNRRDSRNGGPFAVGMDGKECVVKINDETAHIEEAEAIQCLSAFLGWFNVGNVSKRYQPETGWETSDL